MDLIFSKIKDFKIKVNDMNLENKEKECSEITVLCQDLNDKTVIDESDKEVKKEEKELTVDGIPTIKQQLKDIEEDEKLMKSNITFSEDVRKRRDIINKLKVICLHKMGKECLANVSLMSHEEKKTLINLMNEYYYSNEENITSEFNKICNDKLFSPGKDYSNYPVYNF